MELSNRQLVAQSNSRSQSNREFHKTKRKKWSASSKTPKRRCRLQFKLTSSEFLEKIVTRCSQSSPNSKRKTLAFTCSSPTTERTSETMQTSGHTVALEEARISARRIFSLIADELVQVEAEFERQARSNVQV